ncbi:SDR family NAD(P)-dependent oxidoreductase [Pontixanthobacter gangjinensis]|uniref:SDR family NAD(P)-dependent oxidoreductase n=1 Tax=Pontixanthobacter gangjinensis TaxID=1028742 RepID=A0A6I4SNE1_9SPHN|nr:SDR family NAD(P)-dependent oxidoreductase [Pontixanthobacter gangjinensis]MXO56878.1 SDR family NAD(P)-dependent oxidoreductase [Pontixanthobacter gangjinensis]
MSDVGQHEHDWPRCAVVFGASGGIGAAFTEAFQEWDVDHIFAGSRCGDSSTHPSVRNFAFDLTDEVSIAAAADLVRDRKPDLIVIATGILTLTENSGPERSYRKIDPRSMEEVLRLNTIGPAIIAKHFLPLMPRDRRAVFAALSARVGSISDNGLGGWHSYRASKAALNMLLKNFAIELGRTHKHAVIAGLHPGTVDTPLSEPFQSNVPSGKLFTPKYSASAMLDVLSQLTPNDSGEVFDFAGERLEA